MVIPVLVIKQVINYCSQAVDGIKGGFRIGFNYAHPLRSTERNMHSVKSYPEAIDGYLAEECAAGRIIGPLPRESVPGIQVSRFSLIPKKTPGEWRLIVDLSAPGKGLA